MSRRPAIRLTRRTFLKSAAVGAGALVARRAGIASAAISKGPSSTLDSYVLPSAPGVDIMSLLSVGDAAGNGYRMAGIPDGLGAWRDADGTINLLMNHEITHLNGVTRAHGSVGAFVSQWTFDAKTMKFSTGKDLTPSGGKVFQWDVAGQKYRTGTTEWQRLCSADLPLQSALQYGDLGTTDRIFFDGEEVEDDARGWARIVSGPNAGEAWQLPRLGHSAFENIVACPNGGEKTIIMMMDDATLPPANGKPVAGTYYCQLYLYIGTKLAEGTTIEKAGLTNGKLYGMRVRRGDTLLDQEDNANGLGNSSTGYVGKGRFEWALLGDDGDVSSMSPSAFEAHSQAMGLFKFQRPEDGAWDPRFLMGENFYFVTTASITMNSRLWHIRFDTLRWPERGGNIEVSLNATVGRMFDNIAIDKRGRLLLQEDTGNDPYVSKVWVYGLDTGNFVEVAHHDAAIFEPAGAKFFTQDEESSGIIDAEDLLGPGWFLLDVQVHKTNPDPALQEYGQLVAMFVPSEIGRHFV